MLLIKKKSYNNKEAHELSNESDFDIDLPKINLYRGKMSCIFSIFIISCLCLLKILPTRGLFHFRKWWQSTSPSPGAPFTHPPLWIIPRTVEALRDKRGYPTLYCRNLKLKTNLSSECKFLLFLFLSKEKGKTTACFTWHVCLQWLTPRKFWGGKPTWLLPLGNSLFLGMRILAPILWDLGTVAWGSGSVFLPWSYKPWGKPRLSL